MNEITIAYLDKTMTYKHPETKKHEITWVLEPKEIIDNWQTSLQLTAYGFIPENIGFPELLYFNMVIHVAVIDVWQKCRTEYFAVMFDDVKFESFDEALDECLYIIKNTNKKLVGLPPTEWEQTGYFNWLPWRFYFMKHDDFMPLSALHLWRKYHYPHFYITQLAELFTPNDVQFLKAKWQHQRT